jgi:branched-chain amino acid transport system substrate-binding protein
MPLTGDSASGGILVRDAVTLAIYDIDAAGGIGGSELVLDARDDMQYADMGAANVKTFIADAKTVAMIGPWGSNPAVAEIPFTTPPACSSAAPRTPGRG